MGYDSTKDSSDYILKYIQGIKSYLSSHDRVRLHLMPTAP